MTRPEFTPDHDNGFKEFSSSEKTRTATRFRKGIDGLLEKHFEDVESYRASDNSLVQNVGLAFDGINSVYDVIVTRKTPGSGSGTPKYYLIITDSPKLGIPTDNPATEYDYSLEEDGTVKRVQYTISERLRQLSEKSGIERVNPLTPFTVEGMAQTVQDEAELIELEASFGMQNQPVAEKEVNQFLHIAEKSELLPVAFEDLYADHERRLEEDVDVQPDDAARGATLFIDTVQKTEDDHAPLAQTAPIDENITETAIELGSEDGSLVVNYGHLTLGTDTKRFFVRTLLRQDGQSILFVFGTTESGVIAQRNIFAQDRVEPIETTTQLGTRDVRRVLRFLNDPSAYMSQA